MEGGKEKSERKWMYQSHESAEGHTILPRLKQTELFIEFKLPCAPLKEGKNLLGCFHKRIKNLQKLKKKAKMNKKEAHPHPNPIQCPRYPTREVGKYICPQHKTSYTAMIRPAENETQKAQVFMRNSIYGGRAVIHKI